MKNMETRLMMLAAFVLTLAAGAVGGMLIYRLMPVGSSTNATALSGSKEAKSPLAEALQLSPDQSKKMQQIWEGVRETAGDCLLQAQALQHDREQAMVALLTNEQRVRYDKLNADFNAKIEALKARREKTFQQAVDQTRTILTEPQRAKYEKLLRDRTGRDATQPPGPDALSMMTPTFGWFTAHGG
jgi:hypothetical protein